MQFLLVYDMTLLCTGAVGPLFGDHFEEGSLASRGSSSSREKCGQVGGGSIVVVRRLKRRGLDRLEGVSQLSRSIRE